VKEFFFFAMFFFSVVSTASQNFRILQVISEREIAAAFPLMLDAFVTGCSRSTMFAMQLCDTDGDGFINATEMLAYETGLGQQFALQVSVGASHDDHEHRKRAEEASEAASEAMFAPICKTGSALVNDFDVDDDGRISRSEFSFAVPSLLALASGACRLPPPPPACLYEKPSASAAWGAGIGAAILISLISLCGVLIIPFQKPKFRQLALSPLLSFAVGSLLGDALLHLIPQAIGVHEHDEEEQDAGTEVSFVWYMLVVLLGIVAFFVLERHIEHLHGPDDHHEHHHHHNDLGHGHQHADTTQQAVAPNCHNPGHAHDQSSSATASASASSSSSLAAEGETPSKRRHHRTSTSKKQHRRHRREESLRREESDMIDMESADSQQSEAPLAADSVAASAAASGEPQKPQTILTVGWLNLVSDAVHNFVDGIAIGASFSFSLEVGLATSIAIFFHELPQELADYAILIHAGFTKPQALLLNLLTALTAVLGAVIGLAVGTNALDGSRWLLAFTAGNFLYIALADMVQSLHQLRGWWATLTQLFTMAVGIGVMLGLTFVEELLTGCVI
jgi:zinc transporter ZupT